MEQGFDDFREETIWQFMQHACPDILSLRDKMQKLEEASGKAGGEGLQGILDQYARTESRYAHLDGYHYESNIKRVLIGLGYPEETWEKTGGQAVRRPEDPSAAGGGSGEFPGSADPGRTHQPSGYCHERMAGKIPSGIPGRRAGDFSRPGFPG